MSAPCENMKNTIADFVLGKLDQRQSDALTAHIANCASCADYLKALENRKNSLDQLSQTIDAEMPARIDRTIKALNRSAIEQKSHTVSIWRMIMKNKSIRLATAAVIIIATMIGIYVINGTVDLTPAAYAVEQTIEAMRKVTNCYIMGRDWEGRPVEMWCTFNPDTQLPDFWRVDERAKGKITIMTPELTWTYVEESNTVWKQYSPGLTTVFRPNSFVEDLDMLMQSHNGQITTSWVIDPNTDEDVILVKFSSFILDVNIFVEPETRLPIRVNTTRGIKPNPNEILKHADAISFDCHLPEGIFDFQIPDGATVIDRKHSLDAQPITQEVIERLVEIHIESADSGGTKRLPCNTLVRFLNPENRLFGGNVLIPKNTSDKAISEDISVATFGGWQAEAVLFNANGVLQCSRVVQTRALPRRFRLYWTPDKPLEPGQSRQLLCWYGNGRDLSAELSSGPAKIRIDNFLGCHAVENFILVVPQDVNIRSQSQDYTWHETIAQHDLYIWQEEISGQKGHTVDIEIAIGQAAP